MKFQNNFFKLTFLVLVMVLISTVILTVSRSIFLLQQVDATMLSGREQDLYRAFFVGFRFDLKVATIAFAPIFLLGLLFSGWPLIYQKIQKVVPFYAIFIFFLLTAFSIGNYYYYITFANYFDVFIFGLFDDDTEAVLVNAWSDYPIVLSFIATVIITAISYYALLAATKVNIEGGHFLARRSLHWGVITPIVLATILFYAVLARGGVSTLPLKRYHANVSDYDVLNKATPNAFMALDWARGDYKEQDKFEPISQSELTAQMQKVLGQATPNYKTPSNEYLAGNKPHVVMTLMEGFGTNVLIGDDEDNNDLLGALRQPFQQDFVFKRFLAGTTATIDSMVMMLFHSGNSAISHSSVQKTPLYGSAVLPYKEAGYQVVYITAGNAMWRNLANYLPIQGFDTIVDENTLKREFPEAEKYAATWGVPDEYAFKYAEKLLTESDKPLMIYILTVTNHSPFMPPDSYVAKPTTVSPRLNQLLGSLQEHGKALLDTYQYANDAFGQFIGNIKQSDLASRTIIASSGDHRMRYLDNKEASEKAISFAVPFYLYVPDEILHNVPYQYDAQRVGSHKDIFPTLYHFSLSDAAYVSLGGNNILSSEPTDSFGYNTVFSINDEGVYQNQHPDKLYLWSEDGLHNVVQPVKNERSQQAKQYKKLQDYYLRWRVVK